MLYFVNSGLFNLTQEVSSNEYGEFVKMSINTSDKVIKNDVNDKSKSKSSIRTIAKLVSPVQYQIGFDNSQTPDDCSVDFTNPPLNLSYSVNYNSPNNDPKLLFKFQEDKRDNGIFVVAIPFNGILIPLKESPEYRILKGVVSISDNYTVNYNNKKYKKVLYLVIAPKFYSNVEKVSQEDLIIDFESYSYNKPKENPADNTSTHESFRLQINNPRNIDPSKENDFSAWELFYKVENNIPCRDLSEYKNVPMFKVFRHTDNMKSQSTPNKISTSVKQAWNKAANNKKK